MNQMPPTPDTDTSTDPKPLSPAQLAHQAEIERIQKSCLAADSLSALHSVQVDFYQRLDEGISAAWTHSGKQSACQTGCDYCCHFRVDVSAAEVFALTDALRSDLSETQWQALQAKAKKRQRAVSAMNQVARLQSNVACPLLEDKQCIAHSYRPSMCRKMHSSDVSVCKRSFENPQDQTITNAENPLVVALAGTMIDAARNGFHTAKFDAQSFDLTTVLYEAMSKPELAERWQQGKHPFPASSSAPLAS